MPPLTQRPAARTAGARMAAVQPMNEAPTSSLPRGGISSQRMHRRWMDDYQGWQAWARRFSRTMGIVRFATGLKADSCARCILRIEERDPTTGEWDETDDQRLGASIFDAYRNDLEETPELIRAHAWHYSIAGELGQVVSDGDHGSPNWGIYSIQALDRNQPRKGLTRVKLTPNGHERDGTAFVVPTEAAMRMWIPDEEWKAFATSPMAASIEPLHRYHSLTRTVKRIADSRLVQNGMIWTPEKAHESFDTEDEAEEQRGAGATKPRSKTQADFYEIARRVFEDDDDILAVAPYMVWWGEAGDEPKPIEIGSNLDEQGIAHRREALEDFARGIDLPTSIVVGGGPGDKNHWTEWLVDAKYFGQAVAPTMDRITHSDLTRTFLAPVVRFYRLPADRFRVGYDPGPVIVQPDQSDKALRYHLAGLLGDEATLEAGNFDLAQIMKRDELARLLQVLAPRAAGAPIVVSTSDAPAGPENVTPGPPTTPAAPTAAVAAVPDRGVAAANRALGRLTQIRRDAGRGLLAAAQVAFHEAVRRASGKVATRARSRKQTDPAVRAAAVEAAAAGAALGAHMAAVGITELEAFDGAFDTFGDEARSMLDRAQQRERQAIAAAGLDEDLILPRDPQRQEDAAAYIAAALMALALIRLRDGPVTVSTIGEISGAVPGSIVANALAIADGAAAATIGEVLDEMPTVATIDGAMSLEAMIASELLGGDGAIEYTWEWGFYGDPVRPFEIHEDLGFTGFTTTDPENDPALPETPWGVAQPQDHDGCTCTWVPSARETHGVESGPGERPVNFPS